MCMHCTRRQFLGTSAMSGIVLATARLAAGEDATSGAQPAADAKVRIAAIIAGKPEERSWCLSQDEVAPLVNRLAEVEKNLGNVEFVIGRAAKPEQAAELMKQAGDDAPVLADLAEIFGLTRGVMPTVFEQAAGGRVSHAGGRRARLVPREAVARERGTASRSSIQAMRTT